MMNIAEKIMRAKADYDEVFEAGQKSEYDRFWDTYQCNGERNIYYYGFSGAGWNEETFKPKYKIVPKAGQTTTQGMFAGFSANNGISGIKIVDFTKLSEMIDFSQATTAPNTFDSAYIKNLTVDFSNLTSMNSTFALNNGGNVDGIIIKVSEKCTSFSNAFYNNYNLKNICFTEDSIIAGSINFKWSSGLYKASIINIINTLSFTTSAYTVTFSKTAVNNAFETTAGAADGTTSQEWANLIATKSNWTISLV